LAAISGAHRSIAISAATQANAADGGAALSIGGQMTCRRIQ
jgi:hypothetical protein